MFPKRTTSLVPGGVLALPATTSQFPDVSQAVLSDPRQATIFGQSMHLLLDESVSEHAIRERLATVGIREADIRPIAASLEDVFVTLTAHIEEEGRAA